MKFNVIYLIAFNKMLQFIGFTIDFNLKVQAIKDPPFLASYTAKVSSIMINRIISKWDGIEKKFKFES